MNNNLSAMSETCLDAPMLVSAPELERNAMGRRSKQLELAPVSPRRCRTRSLQFELGPGVLDLYYWQDPSGDQRAFLNYSARARYTCAGEPLLDSPGSADIALGATPCLDQIANFVFDKCISEMLENNNVSIFLCFACALFQVSALPAGHFDHVDCVSYVRELRKYGDFDPLLYSFLLPTEKDMQVSL